MTQYTPSFELEQQHAGCVVGLDEAGIGCWAGDVFAGVAHVPYDTAPSLLALLNDSKKLTQKKREDVFALFSNAGIKWAVASASLEEIEQLNIRGAALKAMHTAYEKLNLPANTALIDGTLAPKLPCKTITVVKGDQRSYCIAAASIAVKVTRDHYMQKLDEEFPLYGWAKNAGYGTKQHQEALRLHGITPYHRKTFAPIQALLP